MVHLLLPSPADRPLRILCLGAHADDIEIGCGGTVATLVGSDRDVHVDWIVLSADGIRAQEAQAGARAMLGAASHRVEVETFPDGYFPARFEAIKRRMEELATECRPDVIFTHHRFDRHQDHRVVAELTWNTWRDHLVLEYEVPKYEGDLGLPNLFSPLARSAAGKKVETLLTCFPSQASKPWFDRELLEGLMRIRGVECRAPEGLAEAFHAPKVVLGP